MHHHLKSRWFFALVVIVSMTAVAELISLSEENMRETTAQDGISLAIEPGLLLQIDSIVVVDDANSDQTVSDAGGALALSDILIAGHRNPESFTGLGYDPLIIAVDNPLTIDVERRSFGAVADDPATPLIDESMPGTLKSVLAIGLPPLTLSVKIDNIKLGHDEASAISASHGLGGLSVNNLSVVTEDTDVLLFTR